MTLNPLKRAGVAGLLISLALGLASASVQAAPPVEVHRSTVNINTASVSELESLPGVGAVRARAIIEERKQRLRDQEAEKERAKEENRGLGRHPNWDKAVNDPDNAAQYLKTKVDKEWWKKEGYKLAQRRELAKARERAPSAFRTRLHG